MDPDPLSCIFLLLNQIAPSAEQTSPLFNPPTLGSIIAIVVAVFGLFLSAFNSGSEIAFFSLKSKDVEEIADDVRRDRVTSLLKTPERLLATILIGNNLVNVMIIIVLNFAMNQMFNFVGHPVANFIVQTVILTFHIFALE